MALFNWTDKFSVDVKTFDEQHKNLINLINDLYDAMKLGKGNQILGKIFDSLIDYTKNHFNDEEEVMRKVFYPEYLNHKSEHVKLTDKVLEYKKKFENNEILISVDLLGFLRDWLTNHIMNTDKKYGEFFKNKGIE